METNMENFIRERITELRMKRGISEYKMSYELGQNKSYIQSISSGRALPSMTQFIKICDYFDMTPLEFFDVDNKNPSLVRSIVDKIKLFSNEDLMLIYSLVNRISNAD